MDDIFDLKLKRPEILSPAGTFDALKAAVNAGCDAVYMGGNLFSARAYAGNFGKEEMIKAVDFCHLYGVKAYMTVNILLKESEIPALRDYMQPYYDAGLDGVIVQDMGVFRVLRENFPGLALHASTQMSISSEYGARLMKRMGAVRIVPSRELSLEEIISIRKNVDIEIESFVHGAMCFSYSGKCLFSAFFGGRSGNRGRCAQPCRQKYGSDIIEKNRSVSGDEAYILSMKDMCTLQVLPQLVDAGIDSFKIEGRMKNPYYVASVTDAYARALDKYIEIICRAQKQGKGCSWRELDEKAREEYLELAGVLTERLQDVYNRGGFHSGYYFTDKGPEMMAEKRPNHEGILTGNIVSVKAPDIKIELLRDINPGDVLEIMGPGIELTSNVSGSAGDVISLKGKELKKIRPGMKIHRTRNNVLLKEIEDELLHKERKVEAAAGITAKKGRPLEISISDRTGRICVKQEGNVVQKAESLPVSEQSLISKMRKTGGTALDLTVECELDDDVFVAMSDFNNVRRAAMDEFVKSVCASYHRK